MISSFPRCKALIWALILFVYIPYSFCEQIEIEGDSLPDFSSGKYSHSVDISDQFPPARTQEGGSCSICAATDLIESAYYREYGERINFTEAYLVYRNIRKNSSSDRISPSEYLDPNYEHQYRKATPDSTGVRMFLTDEQWATKKIALDKGLLADIWDGGDSMESLTRICNGSYCLDNEPDTGLQFQEFIRKTFRDVRKDGQEAYESWERVKIAEAEAAKEKAQETFDKKIADENDGVFGWHQGVGLFVGGILGEGARHLFKDSSNKAQCDPSLLGALAPMMAGGVLGAAGAEGLDQLRKYRRKSNHKEQLTSIDASTVQEKSKKKKEIYKECVDEFCRRIDNRARKDFNLEVGLNDEHNQGFATINESPSKLNRLLDGIQPIAINQPSHRLMVDILSKGRPFALGGDYIPDPEGKTLGSHIAIVVGYKRDQNAPGGVSYLIRNSWGIDPVWSHIKLDRSHRIIVIGKKKPGGRG